MRVASQLLLCAVILLRCAAAAEPVIPTKSGTLNYAEGKVFVDSKEIAVKGKVLPRMQVNQTLQTGEDRVEILLGPGSFLRIDGNSTVKMLSDRFDDTRLELVKGSAIVECLELPSDIAVTLLHNKATVSLLKSGVYRLDAEPAQLSVYDGEARVEMAGQIQTVKKARRLPLNGLSTDQEFDKRTRDPLLQWVRQRSKSLSTANQPAARSISEISGSAWVFSDTCRCYTFVPDRGTSLCFWGFTYWSPYSVARSASDPWTWHSVFDRGSGVGQAPPPR